MSFPQGISTVKIIKDNKVKFPIWVAVYCILSP